MHSSIKLNNEFTANQVIRQFTNSFHYLIIISGTLHEDVLIQENSNVVTNADTKLDLVLIDREPFGHSYADKVDAKKHFGWLECRHMQPSSQSQEEHYAIHGNVYIGKDKLNFYWDLLTNKKNLEFMEIKIEKNQEGGEDEITKGFSWPLDEPVFIDGIILEFN